MITRITTHITTMMLTYHLAMLAYTLRLPAHGYCPRSPEHLCHYHDSDEVINLGYMRKDNVYVVRNTQNHLPLSVITKLNRIDETGKPM